MIKDEETDWVDVAIYAAFLWYIDEGYRYEPGYDHKNDDGLEP